MSSHLDKFLSQYCCGCRKRFRTQRVLLSLIGKWKNVLGQKWYGGNVLMDLSKE